MCIDREFHKHFVAFKVSALKTLLFVSHIDFSNNFLLIKLLISYYCYDIEKEFFTYPRVPEALAINILKRGN